MSTVSATNFAKNPSEYINNIITNNEVITVSAKSGSVLILNPEKYKKQVAEIAELQALEALKKAADDVENGRVSTHEEVFQRLQKKIDAKRAEIR